MTGGAAALEALVAGLRGQPVETADWTAVIALANRTLLTPALFESLAESGQIADLPDDVADYLGFIHGCNRQRNLRLRTQLVEALRALNGCGIVPVLLKGAISLVLCDGVRVPGRMMSDLDLAVEADEEARARACLKTLGYVDLPRDRGMARPRDPGPVEIRPLQAIGPDLPRLLERDGLRLKIPTPQSRALHLIMHDLFKEGDYWRGRIDLRHLRDLAELAETGEIDWVAMRSSMTDQSARNAFDTQLLSLDRLFDVPTPAVLTRRPIVRLQNWRRMFTARHRLAGAPLRFAGNVVWGIRRMVQQDDLLQRGPFDFARRVARSLFEFRSKI